MSCQTEANKIAGTSARAGIGQSASKQAFLAGTTPQVSFFSLKPKDQGRQQRAKEETRAAPKKRARRNRKVGTKSNVEATLPTQRQIRISGAFKHNQLQALYVQLALGQAATRRHIQEMGGGAVRAISFGDPRPLDWAQRDLTQYEFLTDQLRTARRDEGVIETGGLSKQALSELWAFAKFEAERAQRNIDHLRVPGGPIGPPASHYLAGKHVLEARFYTLLAEQIETMLPLPELHAKQLEFEGVLTE
jgi:hypothetical protein